jgi:hypothetical protein
LLWQLMCGGGLRDQSAARDVEITGAMRLDRLAQLWLAEKADEGVLPQTLDRYETSLRTRILPALGRLRLVEAASISRLDRFLKTIASSHPASARNARTVLGQMLAMAVRHDALDTNPVRELARRRNRRREVRALDITDLGQARAAIRAWYAAQAHRPGPITAAISPTSSICCWPPARGWGRCSPSGGAMSTSPVLVRR